MSKDSKFASWMNRLPVDNEKLIAQGVAFYLSMQDPEDIEFTKYTNGYQITVKAGEEEAEEAYQFWNENVAPALGENK